MASEARSIAVTLTGGGPWGFRLRGGRGTGTPLTVLKTRRKSKAHQVLLEGDVLVSVNGTPCDSLSHDQVMAIVDSGCAELRLQLLRGGTDPSNKENVRTEVPWSSPVWAPKSGDALANLKGTSLQSESSPRCLREVQSSVERDKDPSTGALRETHTTLEKESQKGPGSVSQSLTETTKVSSSLPSGGSMYSLTVTNRSTTTTTDPKKVAPPTAPKPKLWLNTDIKSDVQRFGFPPERPASSASDASLPGQGVPQQGSPLLSPTGLPLLPKFYEPPGDNNSAMDFDAFKHHKKKTFSSSSFYEEPNCIYPTVEEQVELARKIADSLSADTNRTSRGANMFFKRVKRSHKWIHEAPDYSDSEATLSGTETSREDDRTPDPLNVPYKVSKGPPRLKLILDPRHLQDANTLRQSGISIVEHSAISPEVCLDLVKDLNSPCGKGAAMFAKRKKKSEEWVVDVDRIKAQLGDRWPEPHQPVAPIRTPIKTPVDRFKESLVNPRLRIVKSPWEAALESPIGSCEKAFAVVRPHEVVESVIRAAEAKGPLEAYQNGYGTYDSAVSPVPPPVTTVTYNPTDPCLARAPRGWRGPTSQPTYEPSHSGGGGSSTGSSPWPPQPAAEIAAPTTSLYPPMPKTSALSPAPAFGSAPTHPHISLSQFQNFNSLPRSWSPRAERAESFRPVRPPAAFAH